MFSYYWKSQKKSLTSFTDFPLSYSQVQRLQPTTSTNGSDCHFNYYRFEECSTVITVAAWDPGVQLLTVLQTGCLTSGFTSLYPVFPDGVIIDGNFRKIIEDKYIKGCVLLGSSSTSTE